MKAIYTLCNKPEGGKLLLSEPFLKDLYFSRSVILLAEHNNEGTYGLILNKPIPDLSITEVVKELPKDFDCPVYLGGPVKTDSVFYLHTLGNLIEGSIKINDNIYFGGEIEQIKELILFNKITPQNIKFYIGYSGWEPKQLDNELKENSWIIVDYNNYNLLQNTPQVLWNNILKNMGDKFVFWSVSPIDPHLN